MEKVVKTDWTVIIIHATFYKDSGSLLVTTVFAKVLANTKVEAKAKVEG